MDLSEELMNNNNEPFEKQSPVFGTVIICEVDDYFTDYPIMAIIKEFDQHIYLTNEGKYLKVAEKSIFDK